VDYSRSDETKKYVDERVAEANSNQNKLQEIMNQLYYFPSYWKDTETKINYRRFFTINGLICVNVQHEHVFDATHKLIATWIRKWIN
jgi:(1->4)-alpha-D-glucan 1-alpha-D-glucosylmutase